jgi:hypothetical protein
MRIIIFKNINLKINIKIHKKIHVKKYVFGMSYKLMNEA